MPAARLALILGLAIGAAALTVALAAWLGPVAGGAGLGAALVVGVLARAALGGGA